MLVEHHPNTSVYEVYLQQFGKERAVCATQVFLLFFHLKLYNRVKVRDRKESELGKHGWLQAEICSV